MKKKSLLWISALLLILAGCSSSDDDLNESLLNHSWMLVSYGNESNAVLKEANGYYYTITFHPNGRFSGNAYGNQLEGEYKCYLGNIIRLSSFFITQKQVEGSDPDMFFLEHLSDVSTYVINDKELRLYYSKDEYFKFKYMDSTYSKK